MIYYFPDTRPSTWSKRKTNQKSKPKILPDIFKKLVHFSNKTFNAVFIAMSQLNLIYVGWLNKVRLVVKPFDDRSSTQVSPANAFVRFLFYFWLKPNSLSQLNTTRHTVANKTMFFGAVEKKYVQVR